MRFVVPLVNLHVALNFATNNPGKHLEFKGRIRSFSCIR
jgi:hypothetical protein